MNEQVEEMYKQMFAPQPIPDAVRTAFDRTNFLANRIDAGMMSPVQLAIIAGAAIQGLYKSVTPAAVSANKPIDTSEAQTEPPQTNEPPAEPTEPTQTNEPASTGPTGIMDAPPKPDKKRRGLAAAKMQKLTIRELKVHAEQIYGWEVPTGWNKTEIIAVLKSREPLGP